jgi:FtsZ-interacting cell division protein ZipA
VIVGIVIVVVLVALVAVMKWADRRDRANGHTNRRMGDVRSTIREQRMNARMLRQPGARSAARSPHHVPPANESSHRSKRT